jgi:hypothetical protein
MPKTRTEPPDLTTQAGRLVWARSAAGYPSARKAAELNRWVVNTYKSRETAMRRDKGGIPPDDLELYADRFKVDLTWLAFGIGRPFPQVTEEQLKSYPVRGTSVKNGRRVFDSDPAPSEPRRKAG